MTDQERLDGVAPALPTVTVSPMRHRHLRSVLAIEGAVYPRPWSSRLFAEELDRSRRSYLVARVGPTVVGHAGLLMIADDGHVATVAVEPAWHGRQIATRLLVELVRQAVAMGANQLTLEVRMSNDRAQGLYRRFGFVPAGARKAYYAESGEDALVMWAHDVTTDDYARRLASLEATLPTATHRHGFDGPASSVAHQRPTAHPAAAERKVTGS